jgi:hypothetical protein
MGAVVFQRMNLGLLITPQHDLVAQSAQGQRLSAHPIGRANGIPPVFDAVLQDLLNGVNHWEHSSHVSVPP